MKVIDSQVETVVQGPGIVGMLKHIELIGRVSHKSEDKIGERTYVKFIEMLRESGHWACFDMGTVYLKVPLFRFGLIHKLLSKSPWTRWTRSGWYYYITTTYRVILQLGLEREMEKYWSEPGPKHYYRATAKFTCSRFIANQIVRHASLRPLQESMRYINYGREKFGNIIYILPQWAYKNGKKLGLSSKGEELWQELLDKGDSVALGRNAMWEKAESEYMSEISQGLRPEDARGALPLDTKTDIYLCGYLYDWYRPDLMGPEKSGFFPLRSATSTQSDLRVLSIELESQFKKLGYDSRK